MSFERHVTRVPDLVLERYRLGELPVEDAAHLERRLEIDRSLRDRIAALDASDHDIRRRYPPEWLAERVRARLETSGSTAPPQAYSLFRRWPVPAALAAAATLLLVLLPRTVELPFTETGPDTSASSDRVKGLQPALTLFRRTSGGSERLADGTLAHAGDLIRVGYRAAGRAYGIILSIDGRGTVTVHLAGPDARAASLRSGDTMLLDDAYELDAAPRWECFYFVTSDVAFDVAPIVEAARRAAAGATGAVPPRLPLSPGLEQAAITLVKGTQP